MSAAFDPLDLAFKPSLSLVEASAGTGKTYTLARLALRALLEDEVRSVSELLVVTFTNAAAAELHDRIRAEFRTALACLRGTAETDDPHLGPLLSKHAGGDAERRLRRALIEFDEICVSTIHGFCSRTLDIAAFECGVPFRTELVDERRETLRLAVRDFWRREVGARDCAATAIAAFKTWTPDEFVEDYKLHARYPNTTILPAADSIEEARNRVLSATENVRKTWGISQLSDLIEQIQVKAARNNSDVAPAAFPLCLQALGRYCRHGETENAGTALVFARSALDARLYLKPPDVREKILDDPLPAACEELADTVDAFHHALRVACIAEIDERLQSDTDGRVLAYDDLLRRLESALDDPNKTEIVTHAIRERFRVALIDEFQDTDLAQYKVFRRLFDARPLIVVGDPKQAIYGFRGADVFAYLEAKKQASDSATLTKNWRSTPQMIAAVNGLFGYAKRPFVFDAIAFEDVEPPPQHAEAEDIGDGRKALCWLQPPKSPTAGAALEIIARGVAAEISALIDGPARIDDDSVAHSDIAVLTQSNKLAPIVRNALADLGIPATVTQANNVFGSDEAAELECFVAAIARPTDTGAVAAAMATRFWGATAAEIAETTDDDTRFDRACAVFEYARSRWTSAGFSAAVETIFDERETEKGIAEGESPERRLTNLRQLVGLCQSQAQENHYSPEDLRRWLARCRDAEARDRSEEFEEQLESDDDAVRITTIHKAKGLEYEIVFCPDLWDAPGEYNEPVHTDTNTVVLAFDDESKESVEARARAERLAEHARLTYVALTRSRKRCYVVAFPITTPRGKESFGGNFDRSALAHLLLGDDPALDTQLDDIEYCSRALQCAAAHGPDWSDKIRALVDANPETMETADLLPPLATRSTAGPGESPAMTIRKFDADRERLSRPARISSFSGLTHASTKPDRERPDYDAMATVSPASESDPVEDVFAFEKGARAGTCLHDMFEHAPFELWRKHEGPSSAFPDDRVREIVEASLTRHGLERSEANLSASSKMLHHTLRAPLPGAGDRLCDVEERARLAEWQFYVPLGGLRPAGFSDLFRRHAGGRIAEEYAPRLATLDPNEIRGHLTGFVDLVFEAGGRWYILDWKSNHLGNTLSDYGDTALWTAMCEHDYVLQYHLYALGLHRFLRSRSASYDYEDRFGGVCYAFLRGIREDADEPSTGWYFDRPSFELVAALDDAFATGGAR